ncbi:MAG: large conductance mechanosensitive channel protein MscL [Chloroflexota bacterium]|jgi:large conductance mechanosensitive channel
MSQRNIITEGGSRVVGGVGKELGGFRKFLVRGNVVDLAVGIVIGVSFTAVVNALVENVITPIIGIFGGVPDVSTWGFTVAGQTILYGAVINALLTFLITAAVIYFLVVLPVNRLMDRYKPEPKPTPTKDCPECLSAIPEAARRCRECGAQLEPPSEAVMAAMRQVAAPSGAEIADQAAKALSERLAGGSR